MKSDTVIVSRFLIVECEGELIGKILSFIYDTMADFETNLACHMLGDAEKQQ